MKLRGTPRAGVKQTSTPLNNNKGVVFFKTLSNVSSIRNKCTAIKHSVIESPSIFDWKNTSESPTITDSHNNCSKSSEEVSKRRPDTPLKSQRRSRFSDASLLCPMKLRFSKISNSSNVNSKLSDFKRRSSSTVNKYLYGKDKLGSNDAEKEYVKIIKTHENQNTSIEQQTEHVCNVSLDRRLYGKFGEKTYEKHAKTRIRCKRNQATIDRDDEKEEDIDFGRLTSSSTILTENVHDESVDSSKIKSARNDDKRQGKTSKNRTKRQRKDMNISDNFVNETGSSGERQFNESKCSSTHITKGTHGNLQAKNKNRNIESGKELLTKSKRKREGRQEQEKNIDNAEAKSCVEGLGLDSNNMQCSSSKEVIDTVKIFKKPFSVKKKIISKRTVTDKGRKGKNIGIFPPTSTPFDSPATANQKLPLLFESLSPVRSSEKRNKSCSSDGFQIIRIKAKRTYAKTGKINSKLDKEVSKWESFLKKPTYRKKNNNYVSESSILRNSGSIHLFETPPINIKEGSTVETSFPKSRFKRSTVKDSFPESRFKRRTVEDSFPKSRLKKRKVSKMRDTQTETKNSVTTKGVKSKKWFETTKMKELADHFNEISAISLVIENKRKKKKMRKK